MRLLKVFVVAVLIYVALGQDEEAAPADAPPEASNTGEAAPDAQPASPSGPKSTNEAQPADPAAPQPPADPAVAQPPADPAAAQPPAEPNSGAPPQTPDTGAKQDASSGGTEIAKQSNGGMTGTADERCVEQGMTPNLFGIIDWGKCLGKCVSLFDIGHTPIIEMPDGTPCGNFVLRPFKCKGGRCQTQY